MCIITDGYFYVYFTGKLADFYIHPYENFAIGFVRQSKPINDIIVTMEVYNNDHYIITQGSGTYSDFINKGTMIVNGCLGRAEGVNKIRFYLSVPYTIEEINSLIRKKLQFRFSVIDQECFKFDLAGNVYLK